MHRKISRVAFWLLVVTALPVSAARKNKNLLQAEPAQASLSVEQQRKFQYFFLEAEKQKYLQHIDAAFDLFKHCYEIDSTSAIVCYELADGYLKMNNPAEAVDLVRKASQLAPDNYWYLFSFANLAQNLNMNEESIKAFTKLVNTYKDKPELNYSLSEIYAQNKQYRQAIEVLDNLEKKEGLSEELSIEKFRLYATLKENKKAFAEIEKLIAGFPKDVRYKILLGDMYLENNQTQEAFKQYQLAKTQDPDNGYISVSLANYYEKTGNKTEADRLIRDALVNPSTDIETKNRILTGYLSTRLEKPEEAENIKSLFNALIEEHPQEDSFYQLYAEYLLSQKKPEEAREKLQFAVGLAPTNANIWKQLLNINLQLNDYKSVVEVCTKAITYFPEASEFYYYKGIGNYLADKFDEAIENFNQGIKVTDPKNVNLLSDFYGQLGDIYQRLEKKQAAYEAYETALKYNEKNVVVLNNYAYYLSLDKKELDKAEKMSGKSIELEPNNSTYLDTYAWIYFVKENYTLAKFYIEKALKSGGDKSDVIVEHYGDILYKGGEKDKALEQWLMSQSMGNKSETLRKKVESGTYIEEGK
ncbi:tetratricopeptide repeat protein [Parabacteroides sp. FAFU027]|uniref:tetratricopeptide repeat protein n=1 Tax=Parabacteroides sp. FAFU027 TaxID=2922715 RepID=UPI001FAFC4E8|nr:tetratricopeptide repeat protein [Parabacteroides sp. FAFU027]